MYKVKVTADTLRIREQPDTNCEIVGKLRMGVTVECSEERDGWYHLADGQGWISGKYVRVIKQGNSQPTTDDP